MKILRGVVIVLLVLVALFVAGGFLLPAQTELTRSVVIERPVGQVFGVLNGFGEFNEWSPWADIDPDTTYRYEGPASGVGAAMFWQSDDQNVGSGSQKIIAVEGMRRIDVALAFDGQNPALSWYELQPVAEGTKVTWGFQTDFGNNPIYRYIGLLIEGALGESYELGLQQLKDYIEGS